MIQRLTTKIHSEWTIKKHSRTKGAYQPSECGYEAGKSCGLSIQEE